MSSSLQSLTGPGSAFASFPTPSRRISSRDDLANRFGSAVPAPSPSLGSWEGAGGGAGGADHREREHSSSSAGGPHPNGHAAHPDPAPAQRSFSSILSPALAASAAHETTDPLARPFVYSREFLLSLYDEDKASRRPIELARHDIATRDAGGKPWALRDWREGEKELFATSIHPPTARAARPALSQPPHQAAANGTLDLSTLPSLPRERDRTLGVPSVVRGANSLTAGLASSSDKDSLPSANPGVGLGAARRGRGIAPLGSGGVGILGGVLGGLAQTKPRPTSPTSVSTERKKEEIPKPQMAAKEVWQGGRWRRGGGVDGEEDKRPSAFGARRYPTSESVDADPGAPPPAPEATDQSANVRSDAVPTSWDDDDDTDEKPAQSALPTPPSSDGPDVELQPPPAQVQPEPPTDTGYLSDPDLTRHASSILGSLSLDAADDPLLGSSRSLPPGLSPPAPSLSLIDAQWHYRDPTGQLQGPFTATMMHDWYSQRFFTGDLLVKRTHEREFETLDALIRRAHDSDTPFLNAPLQPVAAPPPPPPVSSWAGVPVSSPLDQFASASSNRSFGGFYEPFGASPSASLYDPPRAPSQPSPFGFGALGQDRRAPSSNGMLDPWGAPLPAPAHETSARSFAAAPTSWNSFSSAPNGPSYPQSPSLTQHFQHHQQPADLFASPQQQPQQDLHHLSSQPTDVFGRPQQSLFFESSQLSASAAPDWSRLNGLPLASPQQQAASIHQQQQQLHHQQQQQQQPTPQAQSQAWSSIIAPAPQGPASRLDLPTSTPMPAPIGPPASSFALQQSAWNLPKAPEPQPLSSAFAASPPAPPAPIAAPQPVVESRSSPPSQTLPVPAPSPPSAQTKQQANTSVKTAPALAPVQPVAMPSPPAPTSSVTPKAPPPAPWVKEEETAGPASPSLRQIQEAEARQAEIRRTQERQASARQQALAAVQAAQRAAAAEAEALPSSSTWAASPASTAAPAKAVPAPWLKGKAPAVGKTLKEIQEEEEKRKRAAAAVAAVAQSPVPGVGVRGYAGSIGQTASKSAPGAPWTTIAVKPPAVPVVPVARPVIPGGPIVAPRAAAGLPAKPPAPVSVATARAVVPVQQQQPPARPISRTNGAVKFDAENPPPPSGEFMKWCKDALDGLTVPMDEFIQMLLSFPLDASADVLEIISDSVYANSSTLDGRRFANDFSSRRKLDVTARFPNIVVKSTTPKPAGKPSSMAEALKQQPVVKPPEWQVRVSGAAGKKKKGSK